MVLARDDQVVEDLDAEDLPCAHEAAREVHIVPAGGGGSSEGWLWARMRPEATREIAGRKTSRGWTMEADTLPRLTSCQPVGTLRALR